MKDDLSKKAHYILIALLGLSVILTILFYLRNADFAVRWNIDFVGEAVMLNWAYFLLGVAVVTALVFPIIILAQNPKKAKGALFSLVGLLVVFGLAYVLASGDVLDSYEGYGVDVGTSKSVGMGLIGTYVLMALSGGGIIGFGIMSMFKG
jgi:peptidoglycan/LPS O-acetylase OafA/YrhL